MPEVIVQDNDVIGTEPVIPDTVYTVDLSGGIPYKKIEVTDSATITFPVKYSNLAVKALEGDFTVALTADGESGDDGTIDTADMSDNAARFYNVVSVDTLYVTGTGTVQVWGGDSPDYCPFKKMSKGGGGAAYIGETTTEITNGSDINPIVINGEEVKAKSGDIVKYIFTYYLFNGSVWSEFIDTSDLIVGLIVDEVVIGELVTDE
jgi:hypothetical protein